MIRKRYAVPNVLLVLGAGAMLLLTGCQSGETVALAWTDRLCPGCRPEPRTMPITGLEYSAHDCPSCQDISTLDENTRAAVERSVGGHPGDTVHTCDRCDLMADCPLCLREMI